MLRPVIIAASSAFWFTLSLVIVFFVVFPALVQGLIFFAIGQGLGERRANREYRGHRAQGPSRG